MVECYVSLKDIGLLRPKMPVNFQIDAFNYNQWGMASGKIMEIADDFMLMNNQLVFKVKCQVDDKALSLKNGYHGKLKKGMTLHAQFLVTQRRLYQLLYDKVDNWVNPKLKF